MDRSLLFMNREVRFPLTIPLYMDKARHKIISTALPQISMAERQRLTNGYPPQGYPIPKESESPSPATPHAKKKCKCRLHHDRKGQPRQYQNRGCLEGCLAALCCCCLLDECCCDPTIIFN